jgi:hypothetical protein
VTISEDSLISKNVSEFIEKLNMLANKQGKLKMNKYNQKIAAKQVLNAINIAEKFNYSP